ncbi:MAG: helix-turn-helix domain-containing protein [Dethiobacteria bacterium]|jgi:excisionase family DNA binding protein
MKDEKLLTTREVAKYLDVHVITVRRHLESGILKGHKVGNRWRIKREDVERYLRGE